MACSGELYDTFLSLWLFAADGSKALQHYSSTGEQIESDHGKECTADRRRYEARQLFHEGNRLFDHLLSPCRHHCSHIQHVSLLQLYNQCPHNRISQFLDVLGHYSASHNARARTLGHMASENEERCAKTR